MAQEALMVLQETEEILVNLENKAQMENQAPMDKAVRLVSPVRTVA